MKKTFKNTFKWFFRAIACLLGFIVLYVVVGLVLSVLSTNPKPIVCDNKQELFLTSNGVHVDIVIPRHLVDRNLINQLNIPSSTPYVAFGWGDIGFYLETPTWQDLTPSTAINALFLTSESAMHVTHYPYAFQSWRTLSLCDTQIDLLNKHIWQSFQKAGGQNIIPIGEYGYTRFDRFYEGIGSYSLWNTCNNWVNTGLKKAQVKTAVWSPFNWGIFYHLPQKDEESI